MKYFERASWRMRNWRAGAPSRTRSQDSPMKTRYQKFLKRLSARAAIFGVLGDHRLLVGDATS